MLSFDPDVVKTVNTAAADSHYELSKQLVYGGVDAVRVVAVLAIVALIGWAIWQSKRENVSMS
jgi:predicted negative regulator of RcsB-dependent stress response